MSSSDAVSPFVASSTPHRRRRLLAALVALVALVAALAVPATAQDAPETEDPAEAAAGWLARQLVDGERFEIDFGDIFPDQGLTIDTILALTAAGVADDFAADALAWLTRPDIYQGYLGFGPGSAGKLAVALLVRGLDPADFPDGDGDTAIDIILGAEQSAYWGSAVNVAWAIMALHLAGEEIPEELADLLLSLQCEDGSFGDPFASGDACPGGSDYTAFAVMALVLLEGTGGEVASAAGDGTVSVAATQADIDAALAAAVADLLGRQGADGGFSGNANSTGVAAQALAAAGQADAAAVAAAYLRSIQLGCSAAAADRGAFAVDDDPDARATAQAILGLLVTPYVSLAADPDALGPAPVRSCPVPAGETPVTTVVPVTEVPAQQPAGPTTPPPATQPATAVPASPTFAG